MTKGTVLFHKEFSFEDGGVADKLLIILNTPSNGDPYICCKTTSKCKYNITKEGCHLNPLGYYSPWLATFTYKRWINTPSACGGEVYYSSG